MTSKEIQLECQRAHAMLKRANAKLAKLRRECKHEVTFNGLYSYRVGSIRPAKICHYCGELLRYTDNDTI